MFSLLWSKCPGIALLRILEVYVVENDVIFKTKAFGGYDKKEVMDFVYSLFNEINFLKETLKKTEDKCNELEAEISSREMQASAYEDAKAELENTNAMNLELQNKISLMEDELSQKNDKLSELEAASQNYMSEDAENEIESLKAEIQRLKIECERSRDLERQVGAAMLDARVHSEGLVESARERANIVTKSVYTAIGETALRIDDLSKGVGDIARSFAKSVEDVELRIKALTGDMSKTAQLLITETGVICDTVDTSDSCVTEVEYDFTPKVTDDKNE